METKAPARLEVVKMIADVASQGRYDNVTPVGARNMNTIFVLVAALINELEAEEAQAALAEEDAANEQALQDAAAIAEIEEMNHDGS